MILGILTASTLLPVIGEEIFQDKKGIAIKGYDVVAYHTIGEPVEGKVEFSFDWQGATWLFASLENKALFEKDPLKYAPQYGGYCAWAAAEGSVFKSNPKIWKIVEGELYLNYSKGTQRKWEKDVPGNIAKADASWPELRKGIQ